MPCAVVLRRCLVVRVEAVLQDYCTTKVVVLPSPGTGQRAIRLQVPRNGASLRVIRCFLDDRSALQPHAAAGPVAELDVEILGENCVLRVGPGEREGYGGPRDVTSLSLK